MDEINQYVYSNKPIKALSLYINVYRSAMLLSYLEEFEDNKGVIIIRKSKDRQHNGQQKNDKRTNNDLQSITHKTKDLVTRTPLKPGVNSLRCSGRVSSSVSTIDHRRVTLASNPVISHI
jgi:hypothetical protein